MIQVIYQLFASGCIIYFIFRKRFLDVATIAFLSNFVYFLPAWTGKINNFYGGSHGEILPVQIDPRTYIVFFAGLIAPVSAAVILDVYDSPSAKRNFVHHQNDLSFPCAQAAIFISLFALSIFLLTVDINIVGAGKADILAATDRWYIIYTTTAPLGLIFSAIARARVHFVISIILIIFDLYLGFRGSAAFAAIGLALLYGTKVAEISILKKLIIIAVSVVFFIVMCAYKSLLFAIRINDLDLFLRVISKDKFWQDAVLGSEPFSTQAILNDVIQRDIRHSIDFIGTIITNFIPFSNMFGAEGPDSFGDFYNKHGVVGLGWGVASNVWAEAWASSGPLGIIILSVLLFGFIIAVSKMIEFTHYMTSCWLPPLLMISCIIFFYINRNDIFYTILLVRRIVALSLIIMICAWALDHLRVRPRGYTSPMK